MKIKKSYNVKKRFSEITKINANSKSFDFLKKEPEIYSRKDIKQK
ncbi:MAG: hypothetical protein AAB933_03295 [Patescibacteria group bacterium]